MLGVSAAALLATSPAPPPRSTLTATFSGGASLSTPEPVTGRVTLEVSAAALPRIDDALRRVRGTVTFTSSNPAIRLTVEPVGVAGATTGERANTWDIEQLCRVAEPCRRDFEVTVGRGQGGLPTAFAGFQATLELVYEYQDANPPGAAASWSASAELTESPAYPSKAPSS